MSWILRDLRVACLSLTVAAMGCSFRPDAARPPVQADMAARVVHRDMAMPRFDLAHAAAHDMVVSIDLSPTLDMTPSLFFQSDAQAILQSSGCITATCHGAYSPLLIANPTTKPQWKQNYDNVMVDVRQACDMATVAECAAATLLLTKPLAGSGVDHAGGVKPFASTSDVGYVALLEWIEEGARP